ncbi:poly(R)-hydroxyalkanoic acid synthase subunit PhaE [Halopelagius longus]|uniref:Poly(3-hydroxyalkanoate) polymerase subunit PhaE n=1 Tax=Halopelagius longus TaxID=1236180 RepID=A0A1H1FKM6_9EURY|nr:poly(R)-hydroxyalkanoic acid synthase subunit PhaE [Halopelagius longus]RDI70049.1 poly(R)-hydroxyalkanoic acid synthase subunit [Halopelagius longus]SDR01633.1 Poly(R)-hydroxyalkanoic acid synthase subunit (PHA_synth_III_E) [Halopelagius longus]
MSEEYATAGTEEDWTRFVEETNESFADAFERNAEAQAAFVESWFDAVEESSATDADAWSDGIEGYARAYEVWMAAAEEHLERTIDAVEGEDVDTEEIRDIWLNAANEAFKEVMRTTAFAATTGEAVQNVLEFRQDVDEMSETTLHTLGFATKSDVQEVGERLVELERRQHSVEQKLDRIIDSMEP